MSNKSRAPGYALGIKRLPDRKVVSIISKANWKSLQLEHRCKPRLEMRKSVMEMQSMQKTKQKKSSSKVHRKKG
ncbi:uncharacterized protein LACBIDRAFT_296411 [Laccaria bicolor S238N-H82]|uniref:Predicted protein n=1 Tax=Laccaria bicolor (strain S238N-H82 / ATCC MYA-4686) TaxID=486041 RepID=B0D8R1_LACBS|nr:uncharacterized protein LACBIDRAFT_296411 [Laccaria bicolor S238N-H82]EDR08888.1 predicted protein [Laccaria bicolor S238N-H82]|eukprot:XP_001880201.1 predicted protein [Laccaria bicolor S238N-H82]